MRCEEITSVMRRDEKCDVEGQKVRLEEKNMRQKYDAKRQRYDATRQKCEAKGSSASSHSRCHIHIKCGNP